MANGALYSLTVPGTHPSPRSLHYLRKHLLSTVATQSLTLLNNPFVLGQARLFAEQLEEEAPNDIAQQINLAYLRALTRPPTNEEAAISRQLVEERSLEDLTHVLFNVNEFLYLR